ncbi:MAG: diacylglycerol kinase family protein [Pseudomonadota bacterium]
MARCLFLFPKGSGLSRRYAFLLNPVAGGRRDRRDHPLSEVLRAHHSDAEILLTSAAGDARRLAHERAMESDVVVVAIGGDGTVHEVADGLVGGRASMAVLPWGSGNDFAQMIRNPHELEAALDWWDQAEPRPVDLGRVRLETSTGRQLQVHFINSLGIGFEAEVALKAGRARVFKGFSRYLVAALIHLMRYRAPAMTVRFNDQEVNAPQFLIALGNGRSAGGGFLLTPRAEIDDGWLELCRADDLSVARLLRILPTVLRGEHERFEGVHANQVKAISIDCPEGCGLHADGEHLASDAVRIEVSVLPGGLRLLG